ncbi:MAG TPA: hypothetical protein VG713_18435, partial [Pirellulales bacterium]|nr:hypothetical protein [Pirellulales bacterium]
HSYYLILNSRLAGFQPHELELIANIARYHRGAEPKKKHTNFRPLSSEDRQRVRRMAAILRLAGGLDRTNTQQVHDVAIDAHDGEIALHVLAPELPEVDLWSAHKRAGPFERAFDVSLTIDWRAPEADQQGTGQSAQS